MGPKQPGATGSPREPAGTGRAGGGGGRGGAERTWALALAACVLAGLTARLLPLAAAPGAVSWAERAPVLAPVTGSVVRLREAVALAGRGLSPYATGDYVGDPVVPRAIAWLGGGAAGAAARWDVPLRVGLDAAGAAASAAVFGAAGGAAGGAGRWRAAGAAAWLLNPFAVAASVAGGTGLASPALVLAAAAGALAGRAAPALLALALLLLVDAEALLYVGPPVVLGAWSRARARRGGEAAQQVALGGGAALAAGGAWRLAAWLECAAGGSREGPCEWVPVAQMSPLQAPPSMGVQWYVRSLMFREARPIFHAALGGVGPLLSAAAALQLGDDPLGAAALAALLCACTRSLATFPDMVAPATLLLLCAALGRLGGARHWQLGANLAAWPVLATPFVWHAWAGAGAANANFLLACNLVFLGGCAVLGRSLAAGAPREGGR